MNTSIIRMKSIILDTLTNGSVWIGAIASWQQDLDYWIKILAGVSAVILSWVTIYIKFKNKNKE